MSKHNQTKIDCQSLELEGVRYVILRENVFSMLCRMAKVQTDCPAPDETGATTAVDLDRASLAHKMVQRRRSSGLSQAELARRAGVRVETLNRIERGKTTPDFATIRKLILAMSATEEELAVRSITANSKE